LKRTTKRIVHKLPSYIKSSAQHLLELLKAINFIPSNMSFFSCNAISMLCTNINTKQVLKTLQPFLSALPLCPGCPTNAITAALDILMRQNIFKHDDAFWKKTAPPWQIMPNSTMALLILLTYK
jgi:cytochrome b subunit of formate dehydrogenase